MLDFSKVYEQIQEVGVDAVKEAAHRDVLERAYIALESAVEDEEGFSGRLEENAGWTLWPVAYPIEPFVLNIPLGEPVSSVTVVGVDGSQIMPSHHEVHNCYLLNVGLAVVSYGLEIASSLESVPRLYHRPDDLYPLVDRRRVHVDELYVSLERTLFELEILTERALLSQERGLPVLALFDGSLIPWSLDKMSPSYQETYLKRMQALLKSLQLAAIPLAGYISHSRSSELVNMLRTYVCPYEISNCRENCAGLNEEDFPCSKIWPLTDRQLLTGRLPPDCRTSLCLTSQAISKLLDRENQICFTYLNLDSEVARVEMPYWCAQSNELSNLICTSLKSQTMKGRGYPVVLSEAHNLAVIKSKDREQFFDLMKRHLVSLGVKEVTVSPKESRKRIGFV